MAQATQSDTYEDSPDTSYDDRLAETLPVSDVAAKYGIGQTPIQPRAGELDKWLQDNRLLVEQWIKSHQQKQVLNTEEQKTALQQMEQAQAPIRAEATQAGQQQVAAAQDLAALPRPNLAQPPKLQNFLNRDAAMAMAGIGTLIAGFNSSGKIRGIRANQSLAAGLNGFMAGNLMQAKLGLEDWKNQVEQQLTEFKLMRDQKLDILQASKMNLDEKLLEMQLAAAPYQNQMMQARVEKEGLDGELKNIHELNQMINAGERTMLQADRAIRGINVPLERQKWEVAAQARGYPSFDAAPPSIRDEIMRDTAGLRAQAYQGERRKFEQWKQSDAPIQQKETINWIDQNGRGPQDDPRFANPADRTPKKLGEAGYIFFGDPNVARAYRQSFQALTQLKRIENDVETLYKGVGPGTNIANALALKMQRGMGQPTALQLRRTILETLPTMALAEGMTAGRVGEAILGEFELPQFPTDQDTYASAKKAIDTLRQRLANNIRIYRGTGVNPKLVSQAMGIAEREQGITQPEKQSGGLPGGGQLMPGKIIVINKATGEKGILSEKFFDPSKYDKVPEGQSVKMPAARGSEY